MIETCPSTTVASNIELKNNTSGEFTLIIWIAENGENQNEEMKKRLTGSIQVDASQKIN